MNMTDAISILQNFGFPILVSVVLAVYVWFVNKETRKDFKSREKEIIMANKDMAEALKISAAAITEASTQHELIMKHICTVDRKVDIVDVKLDNIKSGLKF